MKQKIFAVCIALVACVLSGYSQVTSVAGWGIYAMGDNRNRLPRIDGDAMASLTIHDGIVVFALWETESQQSLGPAIILENLYLEQSASEGGSFISMKSKVRMANDATRIGILYLSVSKSDTGSDIIHFDFGDEDLYIIDELIESDMASRLAKLGGVGVGIKNGVKLRIPLEDAIK